MRMRLSCRAGYGRVVMDDINFHECVRANTFEQDRSLVIRPPDGEFVAVRQNRAAPVMCCALGGLLRRS